MKKICAILLIGLLCCGMLCGCGEETAEVPADYDYSNLTEPAVDVKITDCITEQQLSTVLGYPIHLLSLGDGDTQAIYQSEDGACMVSISLKNQDQGAFDADIAALGDAVTMVTTYGEVAYWCSTTGELLVYENGYSLGIAVSIAGVSATETYISQIAEIMVNALKPVA